MHSGKISNFIQRLFQHKYHRKNTSYEDLENAKFNIWLFREHEIHEQDEPAQFRTSTQNHLSMGQLLSHLFDIRPEETSDLYINDNGSFNYFAESSAIWDYDILSPYISNNERTLTPGKHMFYNLLYRPSTKRSDFYDLSNMNADTTILLHTFSPGKYKDSTSYLDVTICIPYFSNAREQQKRFRDNNSCTKSFSIAYDFKTPSQAESEYRFIKEEIDTAHPTTNALTHKEWSLLQNITPDLGNEYYWGRKAFNESRYMDSILYFENVYHALCRKWYKKGLTGKEMSLLTETSFLIGFCYNDLRLYDKAYHYLELASRSNSKTHKYKKEFINCLVNSHNLLSIIYIDEYLQDIKNIQTKERSEEDYTFFFFLLRRKAYILIEMDQFEDAEYILRRLLEEDPDNEVVLRELAFIQNQKKKNNMAEERDIK